MMAKHGFGLQQVLNYRKEIEKVSKVEFATAKNAFDLASERLQREEDKARALARELNDKQSTGILAKDLQLYADFTRKQSNDIKQQRRTVDSLDQKVTEKREELLCAAKEKKVLESFKDKQLKAFSQQQSEKERNFLD